MPKHGYEHINLTPFSKMRVDLAAQVSAELCIHPHSMCYAHNIHLYMQVLSETGRREKISIHAGTRCFNL